MTPPTIAVSGVTHRYAALDNAALDVPEKSIHIIHGTTSARKVVEVDGFSESEMNHH